MPKITVFTPTYNRAYILPQLYNSLSCQTSNDFEWVIVDDGSSDNTSELLCDWERSAKFPIKWQTQSNQGKHIAINKGVSMASGELFFIVDSDDYLTNDAIEKVIKFWESELRSDDISGIIGYRSFAPNKLVGTPLPPDIKQCKLRDTGRKYNSFGDKVVIYRTSILQKFPFPKFGNERFLGESYVYNQIDDLYDMAVMNDCVYMFQYQNDGLSQDFRKLYRNNPMGFLASTLQRLKYENTIKSKIKLQAHIQCLAIHTHNFRVWLRSFCSMTGILASLPSLYLYYRIFIQKVSDVKPYEVSTEINN